MNAQLTIGRVRPLTDGKEYAGEGVEAVRFPFDGSVVAEVESSSLAEVDRAVRSAKAAFPTWRDTPAYKRADIIDAIAGGIETEAAELAHSLVLETGKTLSDAKSEVMRSVATLRASAEEAKRIKGHTVPLDAVASGAGKFGIAIRVPFGVVAGISPFNAPLNLTIHKLGPAIAAGNTFVVKPHLHGSATTLKLAQLCVARGLPAGVFNVVTGGPDVGEALIKHSDVSVVNFTGSTAVGEVIARQAAPRKVLLELGGTGPTIVHTDASLAYAIPLCADGAFGLSGQSCVSVQRVYVHRSLFDDAVERLVALAATRRLGNPLDPQTNLAPMISEDAARRLEDWVNEAVQQGATVRIGGKRQGAMLEATVLTGVTPKMKVVREEVFGPLVSVIPYDDVDEAFAAANAGPYGLKIGFFTNTLPLVLRAIKELEFGTVNINSPSRSRTDHEPSGGAKASGWAKEGPRYAIEEMTYLRMVSIAKMT